jgi:site-specific DNA-methyltransferase (adenine-specific)
MFLEVNKVHKGDAPTLIRKIEQNSVSLSVWSPPYFVGKDYEKDLTYEKWVALLQNTIQAHYEILKPGGFLVVNIADILCFADDQIPKFQSMNIGLHKSPITKEDVVKAKELFPNYNRNQLAEYLGCSEQTIDRRLNGNNIRGGKYGSQTRVHLVGEIIEKSGYEAGLYMYDRRIWKKDPAWMNSKWHNSSYRAIDEFEYLYILWKPGITVINREKLSSQEWKDWGSRPVWEFPSVRANNDHEAKFPVELPSRVIKLLTEKGDIVLDCFIGSGTTAIAAIREERNFIGIELLQKYVDLSKNNIQKERNRILALKKQIKLNFEE